MSGVVLPVSIVRLDGDMVALLESLLFSVTVKPPLGAGVPSVIAKGADCPGETVTLAGRLIEPGGMTVTLAVASGTFGKALA